MGIAMFTLNGLLAPMRALAGWLVSPAPHAMPAPPATATPILVPVRKPLRVVRVVEACGAPAAAGRMVISGRMADVCAELDRLAALESRLH